MFWLDREERGPGVFADSAYLYPVPLSVARVSADSSYQSVIFPLRRFFISCSACTETRRLSVRRRPEHGLDKVSPCLGSSHQTLQERRSVAATITGQVTAGKLRHDSAGNHDRTSGSGELWDILLRTWRLTGNHLKSMETSRTSGPVLARPGSDLRSGSDPSRFWTWSWFWPILVLNLVPVLTSGPVLNLVPVLTRLGSSRASVLKKQRFWLTRWSVSSSALLSVHLTSEPSRTRMWFWKLGPLRFWKRPDCKYILNLFCLKFLISYTFSSRWFMSKFTTDVDKNRPDYLLVHSGEKYWSFRKRSE